MWFALTVKPNHEHTAARALANQEFEAYLPVHRVRRQWSDRIKEIDAVLFPGYVFCRFDLAERSRVLNSAGVRSILASGQSTASVDDAEIDSIRTLIASRRTIQPWPFLRAGERVQIRRGPLENLRGIIVRVNNSLRAVVSVEALTCSVSVEVGIEDLEKSTWPLHRPPAIEPLSFGSLRKSTTA